MDNTEATSVITGEAVETSRTSEGWKAKSFIIRRSSRKNTFWLDGDIVHTLSNK